MKRAVVLVGLLVLLGVTALGGITLRPGIAFMGSTIPSVTVETFVANELSAKFFIMSGEEPGFIAALRQWPDLAAFDVSQNALPVYYGVGVVTQGMDGQYIAGVYAEAGFRFAQMFDVGFAVTQAGSTGAVMLNLGISFDLEVPTESASEPSGI